jgi:hypothetical protein
VHVERRHRCRRTILLVGLATLWARPVSAQPDAPAEARKCQSSECKPAHAQDRAQEPAQAAAAKSSNGGSASHGWFSFFRRQSSALLP